MSKKSTMEMLWPEIKDPAREIAAANADQALSHPIAQTIDLISAYRKQAAIMRSLGDSAKGQLFDTAASVLEQTLAQSIGATPPPGGVTPRPEVSPPGMMET